MFIEATRKHSLIWVRDQKYAAKLSKYQRHSQRAREKGIYTQRDSDRLLLRPAILVIAGFIAIINVKSGLQPVGLLIFATGMAWLICATSFIRFRSHVEIDNDLDLLIAIGLRRGILIDLSMIELLTSSTNRAELSRQSDELREVLTESLIYGHQLELLDCSDEAMRPAIMAAIDQEAVVLRDKLQSMLLAA